MKTKKFPVSCNLDCGGGCPLQAHVENGLLTKITNNQIANKYFSGCIKGFQMFRVLYASDRLKKPLLRTGPKGSGDFKEISWPQALDHIALRLKEIKQKYGNEAILRLRAVLHLS